MYAGKLVSQYNPDSPFMVEVGDEVQPEPVPGNESGETSMQDAYANADTTIQIEGTIDSVYVNDEGDIVVVKEDGQEEVVETEEDKTVALTDDQGNQYVVADGAATPVSGGAGSGSESLTASEEEVDSAVVNLPLVKFKPLATSNFGFDSLKYDAVKPTYNIAQIKGNEYLVPWKSIASGMTNPLAIQLIDNDTIEPADIRFRSAMGEKPLVDAPDGSGKAIAITGQADETVESIEAWYTHTNSSGKEQEVLLGRVDAVSYDKTTPTVKIVPVGESLGGAANLQTKLNEIYITTSQIFDLSHFIEYQ